MERKSIKPEASTAALPGQFCKNHIVTKQNSEGTDCVIKLVEGRRAVVCAYISAEHALQGTVLLGREPHSGTDGICRDFEPRDFGPDID